MSQSHILRTAGNFLMRLRKPSRPIAGKVAVVTGAGSGIGRALAVELSRRGARVFGCDVDPEGLEETTALCGGSFDGHVVDIGNRDEVCDYAARVRQGEGVIHQIYNNAGVSVNRTVLDSDWEAYKYVLRVNLEGVIHCTQAFLPHLIESGDGHLVNLSSLNGYLAQPGLSHYCASKFAVRGFTESLYLEMLDQKLPVRVSVVHPGGVATSIADNALAYAHRRSIEWTVLDERRREFYNRKLLTMEPADAARIVLDGVQRGGLRIRVGRDAVVVDRLVRLLPVTVLRGSLVVERRARSIRGDLD